MSIVVIAIFLIALVVTIFYFIGRKTDGVAEAYYTNVSRATKVENIKKFMSEQTGRYILYVGRESCPDCRDFAPLLNKFIQANGNLSFFYFDTDHIRENKERYKDEDLYLSNTLQVTHVPSMLLINNNSVIQKLTEQEITEKSLSNMVTGQ